jgi:hypothetical protein
MATPGTANTGGGGGGHGYDRGGVPGSPTGAYASGGVGGSGIVIVRWAV